MPRACSIFGAEAPGRQRRQFPDLHRCGIRERPCRRRYRWATALLNVRTWFGSLFSEEAQAECFGQIPHVRIYGIFTPAPVRSERVAGGLRLTGEWWYASGSLHAQWAVLGMKLGDNPDGSPRVGLALVPFIDLT